MRGGGRRGGGCFDGDEEGGKGSSTDKPSIVRKERGAVKYLFT